MLCGSAAEAPIVFRAATRGRAQKDCLSIHNTDCKADNQTIAKQASLSQVEDPAASSEGSPATLGQECGAELQV